MKPFYTISGAGTCKGSIWENCAFDVTSIKFDKKSEYVMRQIFGYIRVHYRAITDLNFVIAEAYIM